MKSSNSTSKILSRRDLDFVLYEWLAVQDLLQRERHSDHSRETFDAVLDASERLATDVFYPINKALDANEPSFDGEQVHTLPALKPALKAFCDGGFMSSGQDMEMGGMQLPYVMTQATFAWFHGASVSITGFPLLTIANANLLMAHGTPQQRETYAKPMFAGRFFGTMCLSEPQAGSSLSDIRTRAVKQSDGSYRLRGNKMWISGGDHEITENIVHLVLAKVPDAQGRLIPGVKGISLFVVPKYLVNADGTLGQRNDVVTAGINHKLGFRGITNCLLNFGEGRFKPDGEAGAIGWLVGEVGQGLKFMFHMMNEARVGVGLGAVMLGYAGYLHALDYACTRPQGRPPQGKDPAAPQSLIIQHADVRRMLLAQKSYVEGGLALSLYCAKLIDDVKTGESDVVRDEAHWLLELLTPIAKSWPSQWCLEANSLAIQVHGGYGYTRDYNVEQYWRENRLNPIHEGTHGIQGLDLLGRKVRMASGKSMRLFEQRVSATAARAHMTEPEFAKWADTLADRLNSARLVAEQLAQVENADLALANASVYLEAFGHIAMAWIWLELALIARAGQITTNSEDASFYHGKVQAARFFFRWELPKVDAMLALLSSVDATTLDMREEWF